MFRLKPPRTRRVIVLLNIDFMGVACCGLLICLFILFGCTEGPGKQTASSSVDHLPNFILIFTDDQGYADVGVYGATDILTPNLDRMSEQGVRFESFYVAAPACTPSRAGLMTGCYPKRVGLHQGVLWPHATIGLNPNEITLAEVLKQRGYATACIGKWHLGRPPSLLPTRQGFDTFFGLPYSHDMTPDHIFSLFGGNFPPVPLMQDETIIEEGVDPTTLTQRYTEEAMRFIRENRWRPFFIYLAHNMPHYPARASEEFEDPIVDPTHRGVYASAVEEIDWGVGRILELLQELGLEENTLVVFTSDNGPWRLVRLLFGEPTGSALPLRGWKGETFEGGMRVPAIMQWTGRLPAGVACGELVTSLDLLPTFAAYAGAELSADPDHKIDGRDVSSVLEEPDSSSPHDYLFYYDSETGLLESVRDAQGWKLHMRKGTRNVRELYNLANDIREAYNVFDLHPDVVYRLRIAAENFDREVTENARPVGDTGNSRED